MSHQEELISVELTTGEFYDVQKWASEQLTNYGVQMGLSDENDPKIQAYRRRANCFAQLVHKLNDSLRFGHRANWDFLRLFQGVFNSELSDSEMQEMREEYAKVVEDAVKFRAKWLARFEMNKRKENTNE